METPVLHLKPRMSEKAYALSQDRNVYVFDVASRSSKQAIVAAITQQFKVTVTHINVANIQGKAKRTITKKGRMVRKGNNNAVRKAYVTLKPGDKLPFFSAIEEAEAKEKVAEEKSLKQGGQSEAGDKKARRGLHLRSKKTEETA